MEYKVVFDVAQAGYQQWGYARAGLLSTLLAVAILVVAMMLKKKPFRLNWYDWLLFVVIAFGIYWTSLAWRDTHSAYATLREDLISGRCQVVEGVVEGFHPVTPGEIYHEYFYVNGVKFDYSDYIESPGFHQTQKQGGPIRTGLKVKIHHKDGVIARLEIRE
ncbi:hypothetical protein [Geothrix sp. PMB-07]|uniref:hypothetical protein n=1 Tax=Geothrix sp. PMB-07 TaxID=3068640 RepID=UPI0027405048|nr:hypothetical protein [Geothrix sp. PMB-07]WLT30664.1 hypothetical protein Q9293_13160 [Geothrix sp. PMB-07]